MKVKGDMLSNIGTLINMSVVTKKNRAQYITKSQQAKGLPLLDSLIN